MGQSGMGVTLPGNTWLLESASRMFSGLRSVCTIPSRWRSERARGQSRASLVAIKRASSAEVSPYKRRR